MKNPPRNRSRAADRGKGRRTRKSGHAGENIGDDVWIWGVHAAAAALANPKRRKVRAYATRNAAGKLGLDAAAPPDFVEIVEPHLLDAKLPDGAVHQGVALRAAPLEPVALEDALGADGPLAILDQVTDPQNIGAIFRSAAAFGVRGLILQSRNAPPLQGVLAKAAAGAVETVDEIRVVNIARAIETLQQAGRHVVGLSGDADLALDQAFDAPSQTAIVLGAEGAGLRPLVAKSCDQLAKIPIEPAMESLNVSNAAAISFYALSRRQGPDA